MTMTMTMTVLLRYTLFTEYFTTDISFMMLLTHRQRLVIFISYGVTQGSTLAHTLLYVDIDDHTKEYK